MLPQHFSLFLPEIRKSVFSRSFPYFSSPRHNRRFRNITASHLKKNPRKDLRIPFLLFFKAFIFSIYSYYVKHNTLYIVFFIKIP